MSIYKLVCKDEENISKFKTDLVYFIHQLRACRVCLKMDFIRFQA